MQPPGGLSRSGFGLRGFIILMTVVIFGGAIAIFVLVGREVGDQLDNIPDVGDLSKEFEVEVDPGKDFAGKKTFQTARGF